MSATHDVALGMPQPPAPRLPGRGAGPAGGRRPGGDRPLPRQPLRVAAAAAPGAVRGGPRLPYRRPVLRRGVGADHRRGDRGRHLLHHVPPQAERRLPGGGVHQHAVRGDGRRRDLRGAPAAPGRRQQRDHRRRQGHPRTHRVQRGLRLRPRRHSQLGVLRRADRREREGAGGRPARRPGRAAHPGCAAVHVQGDRAHPADFPDERPGAVAASGGAGPASLVGLKLAKGEAAPGRIVAPRGESEPSEPPPPPGPGQQPPETHPSSHDAPQPTAASDPSHPAGPAAEEGE